jgi:hypothetical protein
MARLAEHGTRFRYQQGCRCAPCRGANAEYQRQHRRGVCGTVGAPVAAEARRAAMERLPRVAEVAIEMEWVRG